MQYPPETYWFERVVSSKQCPVYGCKCWFYRRFFFLVDFYIGTDKEVTRWFSRN